MKKNQVIITSLAILIAVAGYLNFADVDLGFKDKEASTDSSSILEEVEYDMPDETALLDENGADGQGDLSTTGTPGEAVLTGASDFAAQAKLSREQVRSQNKAELQEIIGNIDISEEKKQEAINTMVSMTELAEKEAAAELPIERILLETDCPCLAPEPYRGKRNSSLYLPRVVAALAELKGLTCQEIEDITWHNGCRFYGLE
mgnify:FL=1